MLEKELACVLLSKSVCIFEMLNAVKLKVSLTSLLSLLQRLNITNYVSVY